MPLTVLYDAAHGLSPKEKHTHKNNDEGFCFSGLRNLEGHVGVFAWVTWVGDDGGLLRDSKYISEQNVGDSCTNVATDYIF